MRDVRPDTDAPNLGHNMSNPGYIRPSFDEIKAKLTDMSRDPFRDALAVLMRCMPDELILTAFAEDHPDRWANAVRAFAQLSGFHDKLQIDSNLMMTIQQMGDAELIEGLRQAMPLIELQAEKVEVGEGEEEEI